LLQNRYHLSKAQISEAKFLTFGMEIEIVVLLHPLKAQVQTLHQVGK
jgi:hypothetical protein